MDLSKKQEISQQLKTYWEALVGKHIPSNQQFLIWAASYDQRVAERGIERVAQWYQKQVNTRQTTIESNELVCYASGVMRKVAASKELEVPRG